MPDKRLGIELTAKDNASAPLKTLRSGLDEIATGALRRVGDSAARFVQQLPQMALEMMKAAAADEALSFRLTQFAGSASKAAEYTKAFQQATENTIPDSTAMAGAVRLLQLDLADTSEEMAAIAAAAVRMGVQTQDAGSRIDTFTNMLAMRSTRALKDFGISAEVVQKELDKVKKAGGDVDEAFKRIVMEQASKQLATLGDTSELSTVKLAKLSSAVEDAKDGFGAMMLSAVTSKDSLLTMGLGVDELTDRIRKLPETVEQVGTILQYGTTWWKHFMQGGFDAGEATYFARDAIRQTLPVIEELTEATGRSVNITNDEVKARLEQGRVVPTVTQVIYDEAQALEIATSAQLGYANNIQPAIDKLNEEKLATADLTITQGRLAEALMDASAQAIASAAIEGLTKLYQEGKVSTDEYTRGTQELQIAYGLASYASIELAKGITDAGEQLSDGQLTVDEYTTRIGLLKQNFDEGKSSADLMAESTKLAGDSFRDLPEAKAFVLTDNLHDAEERAKGVHSAIDAIPNKTVTVTTVHKTVYEGGAGPPSQARASGGYASGLTIVGEKGWEAVILPAGSFVIPHETSEAIIRKPEKEGKSSIGQPPFASAPDQTWAKPGQESWYSKYAEGSTGGRPTVSITFRQNFYVDVASTKQQAMEIANGIEEQLRMRAISRVFA